MSQAELCPCHTLTKANHPLAIFMFGYLLLQTGLPLKLSNKSLLLSCQFANQKKSLMSIILRSVITSLC